MYDFSDLIKKRFVLFPKLNSVFSRLHRSVHLGTLRNYDCNVIQLRFNEKSVLWVGTCAIHIILVDLLGVLCNTYVKFIYLIYLIYLWID